MEVDVEVSNSWVLCELRKCIKISKNSHKNQKYKKIPQKSEIQKIP
jgi:hypothetical protein